MCQGVDIDKDIKKHKTDQILGALNGVGPPARRGPGTQFTPYKVHASIFSELTVVLRDAANKRLTEKLWSLSQLVPFRNQPPYLCAESLSKYF